MNLKPLYFVGMLVATATLGACSDSTDSNAGAVGGQGGATASSTGSGGSTNTGTASGGSSGASGASSTSAVAACKAYCAIRSNATGSCKMTQGACEEYSSCAIQDENPAGFPNCAALSKVYWECLSAQSDVCTAKTSCKTQEDAVAAGCHD